jgi:hypothetical protein
MGCALPAATTHQNSQSSSSSGSSSGMCDYDSGVPHVITSALPSIDFGTDPAPSGHAQQQHILRDEVLQAYLLFYTKPDDSHVYISESSGDGKWLTPGVSIPLSILFENGAGLSAAIAPETTGHLHLSLGGRNSSASLSKRHAHARVARAVDNTFDKTAVDYVELSINGVKDPKSLDAPVTGVRNGGFVYDLGGWADVLNPTGEDAADVWGSTAPDGQSFSPPVSLGDGRFPASRMAVDVEGLLAFSDDTTALGSRPTNIRYVAYADKMNSGIVFPDGLTMDPNDWAAVHVPGGLGSAHVLRFTNTDGNHFSLQHATRAGKSWNYEVLDNVPERVEGDGLVVMSDNQDSFWVFTLSVDGSVMGLRWRDGCGFYATWFTAVPPRSGGTRSKLSGARDVYSNPSTHEKQGALLWTENVSGVVGLGSALFQAL